MSVPIVLLHGFPFDGWMWERQAAYLRGRGHEVFTPDLAGFGATPQAPAPDAETASMEGYADDAQQLIRHAGGRALVGGFSMGGYVLLALLRAHPEAVAGAMFVSTRADADSPQARASRLTSIDDVRAHGTSGLVETMITRLLGKNPTPALREQMRSLMCRQSPAAVIAAQSAMARRRDQTDLLPALAIPILLVAGAEDAVTPPPVARGMQALMPASRLVELAGAGHMTPLEAPAALGEVLAEFAASVSK